MKEKLFILLLLAVTLPSAVLAGKGNISDDQPVPAEPAPLPQLSSKSQTLAVFLDAMLDKTPQSRCSKLLKVLAASPENAEVPMEAFVSSLSQVKNKKILLRDFNAIWQKNPENLLFNQYGIIINLSAGTPAAERLKQIDRFLKADPLRMLSQPQINEKHLTTMLYIVLITLENSGRGKEIRNLFNQWQKLSFPQGKSIPIFIPFANLFYDSAAGNYFRMRAAEGKILDKAFEEALARLRRDEKQITDIKQVSMLADFYNNLHLYKDLMRLTGTAAAKFNTFHACRLMMASAEAAGAIADFDKAAAAIHKFNPRINPAELRFKTLLKAGKYDLAAREMLKLSEKKQNEYKRLLLAAKQDWAAIKKDICHRLNSGSPPDLSELLLLLSIAEKMQDEATYRMASGMLKKHLHIPAVANAVGYVGATMGLDLKQGRRLLLYALKKDPSNFAYLDSMAWIAFKQKKYAEAEKYIMQALRATHPRKGVAVILDHAGDIAAARKKDPAYFYRLALKYATFDEEIDIESVKAKLNKKK